MSDETAQARLANNHHHPGVARDAESESASGKTRSAPAPPDPTREFLRRLDVTPEKVAARCKTPRVLCAFYLSHPDRDWPNHFVAGLEEAVNDAVTGRLAVFDAADHRGVSAEELRRRRKALSDGYYYPFDVCTREERRLAVGLSEIPLDSER